MSHGSYRMDEWTLPLRVVKYGANLDVDGNRMFEICDAKNRTAFFVRINGREFGAAASLEKEILPRILDAFNGTTVVAGWLGSSGSGTGGLASSGSAPAGKKTVSTGSR